MAIPPTSTSDDAPVSPEAAKNDTIACWTAALKNYETVLRSLRHEGEQKRNVVLRLEGVLYTHLPLTISSREPCHITANEYTLIVEWKLRRGRWRHQALPFARMAKEKDVVAASTKAFRYLERGCLGDAFDELIPLLGGSPAVASAVLSVRDPSVPLLSVELVHSVLGEVNFFRETFLKVVDVVRAKARLLSRLDGERTWTAVDVEKALFVKARLPRERFLEGAGMSIEPIANGGNAVNGVKDGETDAEKEGEGVVANGDKNDGIDENDEMDENDETKKNDEMEGDEEDDGYGGAGGDETPLTPFSTRKRRSVRSRRVVMGDVEMEEAESWEEAGDGGEEQLPGAGRTGLRQ